MRTLLSIVTLTILAAGCDSITGASNIEYRVSGNAGRASITYQSSDGGTSQTTNSTLPWSYSWKAAKDDFLYVSAQNSNATGCVTAEIYRKSELLDVATSCGAFVIATASGTNNSK